MEIIFDEAKTRQIFVRVSEEDYQLINALAEDRKLAQATITRGLIEASLRELRKLPITGKNPLFKTKLTKGVSLKPSPSKQEKRGK